MSSDVSLVLAFVAGLLSFLSPCVLPLIPSYLSFVSGVGFVDLGGAGAVRRRIISRTVFFVLGFTIVFVVLGLLFSGPALLFSNASRWINFGAGLIVIVLGVNVMFDLISVLNMEKRMHARNRPAGYLGATVVGMAFGAGWSPCIGPILASILLLAGTQGELSRAALLLLVYSLGLGVPFLAAGAAFTRVSRYLNRIKPYFGTIRVVSGVFLIAIGQLIMFGRFQQLNGWLLSMGNTLERWSEEQPIAARRTLALIPIVLMLLPWGLALRGRRTGEGGHRRRIPGRSGVVISAIFAVTAALQILGIIDAPALIAAWLQFQGV